MVREKIELENEKINVVDRNKQNFLALEYDVMDSLYFDSIYQKMIYIQLKRFANWHTQEAYPSRKLLASLCYCSEAQIKKVVKELELKKLIEVKERFEQGKQLSNLYIILEYPFELIEKHYKNKGGHDITPPKNAGGHTVAPRGSHDSPVGVTTKPLGGHEVATKEKDLKDLDLKEKDLKSEEEEKHLQRYLLTTQYQLLNNLLNENGFTEFQIKAIQRKLANEKILFQLVAPVIEIAIGFYLDGQAKINIESIPAFFLHQIKKAENQYKTQQRKLEKQYQEYEEAKQYEPKIKFYDWIAN